MKERNFGSEPSVFPFIPTQPPGPAIEPEPGRHEDPERDNDSHPDQQPGRRIPGQTKALGGHERGRTTPTPEIKSNIHCLTIGQMRDIWCCRRGIRLPSMNT